MSKVEISSGKRRNIQILADSDGKFRMMAIDQRGSLERALEGVLKRKPSYEDIAKVKKSITKVLSPYSSATLTDPEYGYPHSVHYIPRDVGILLAYEQTGFDTGGKNGVERKSKLIEGWSAAKAKRAAANAIKLLIYYRPEASPETLKHQHELVMKVGEECENYDLPFLLETVGYPLLDEELAQGKSSDTVAFVSKKPNIVIKTVAEFSKPEYKVDILKIEFPADLKYTKEYADGAFDDKKREAVYSLSEVIDICKKVDEASQLPWVILSGGVDIEEFLENVKLATQAGASGFLCGRAIWKNCVNYYPDVEAVEAWLATSGVNNFKMVNEAFKFAKPWFDHKRYKGYPNVELAYRGENWHKDYEGF